MGIVYKTSNKKEKPPLHMYLGSKQHCSTPKRKRPRALESKLGPLIPPADAVALGHGTHFVLVEPFMGMVG